MKITYFLAVFISLSALSSPMKYIQTISEKENKAIIESNNNFNQFYLITKTSEIHYSDKFVCLKLPETQYDDKLNNLSLLSDFF